MGEFLNANNLKEIDQANKINTYIHTGGSSRIDRFYSNRITSKTKTIPYIYSDHQALITSIKKENLKIGKRPAPAYWKMPHQLTENKEFQLNFKQLYERSVTNKDNFTNIDQWWEDLKRKRKKLAVVQTTTIKKENKKMEEMYLELLKDYQEKNLIKNYLQIKKTLKEIEKKKKEGNMLRGKDNEFIENENFNLKHIINEKRKKDQKEIKELELNLKKLETLQK